MFPQIAPQSYHDLCNPAMLHHLPKSALRILDVGCGAGALGAAYKSQHPERQVSGIERNPVAAQRARAHLHQVFEIDVEQGAIELPESSFDAIVFGDVLEHLIDPETVLRRLRTLLDTQGLVLCSVPNVQNHQVLTSLIRGDFAYAPAGLLDATHLRFFTYASFFKLLLDAGYVPDLLGESRVPAEVGLYEAIEPLLRYLKIDPQRTKRYLEAYQYTIVGHPLAYDEEYEDQKFSVACCVSDVTLLQENLLRSPDLAAGSSHQMILLQGATSAAAGLEVALQQATHEWLVFVHQDVYLPRGWFRQLTKQLRLARSRCGDLGVVGVYGIAGRGHDARPVGRVVDRDRLLWERETALPSTVDTLDELVLVMPRRVGWRFNSQLGWHCYGADLCLQAKRSGLTNVVIDAACFHNSRSTVLPSDFVASAQALSQTWPDQLPITTTCAHIGTECWRPFEHSLASKK